MSLSHLSPYSYLWVGHDNSKACFYRIKWKSQEKSRLYDLQQCILEQQNMCKHISPFAQLCQNLRVRFYDTFLKGYLWIPPLSKGVTAWNLLVLFLPRFSPLWKKPGNWNLGLAFDRGLHVEHSAILYQICDSKHYIK